MKRNNMFVVSLLAATFLLVPTGLRAQGEGDHREGGRCSPDQRGNCLLGSFSEIVHADGTTFKALLTVSPGGGAVETNTAQGAPATAHGSWEATKDDDEFAFTFITFGLRGPSMGKTRETITLSDSGDSFTAVFIGVQMDANGNVFATFSGTATGKRIRVEPLGN